MSSLMLECAQRGTRYGSTGFGEKCELAGLGYEVSICIRAVSMGLTTLIGRAEGNDYEETLPRLRVLSKMLEQAEEALDALHGFAEKLLVSGGDGDAKAREIAEDGLMFYADEDNWQKRRGKPSAIEDDGGDAARDALAKMSGKE
jgi:hypothetical protein